MLADRISFIGKSDPIICQYAQDYLKKHKRPHIKNIVSNKVRELGRLLIPLQDLYKINSVLNMLKSENFDKVVSATRIISGYNETLKSFQAPSLALHMKTILLAICSSAKTLVLKKEPVIPIIDHQATLKNIKSFRELVDSNWKFEMGSLALKDLNEKHTVNPQKLPVTQDIISFRTYTQQIAETYMNNLKINSKDIQSFKKLTEATLALTILLYRKRIGDVQYIKLESYHQNLAATNLEECLNTLAESERQLSSFFKRMITVGKGSKSVPILFSQRVQNYVTTLLSVRSTFVLQENPFLFAQTNSFKWVDGAAVLRRYAAKCGAKNPNTLTSSRLRKQIATVLQILNLNDVEMEQVATFMGHTKKTHEVFYRLPQELFQTAKIAKLLLMMEKGVGSENQGKTLDEIDIELGVWNRQSSNELDKDDSDEDTQCELSESSPSTVRQSIPIVEERESDNFITEFGKGNHCKRQIIYTKPAVGKQNCRGSWNSHQKTRMLSFFKNHIKNQIPPKKSECLKLKEKYDDLFKDKNWVQSKVFVYNSYKTKK